MEQEILKRKIKKRIKVKKNCKHCWRRAEVKKEWKRKNQSKIKEKEVKLERKEKEKKIERNWKRREEKVKQRNKEVINIIKMVLSVT